MFEMRQELQNLKNEVAQRNVREQKEKVTRKMSIKSTPEVFVQVQKTSASPQRRRWDTKSNTSNGPIVKAYMPTGPVNKPA